eukprot:1160467-Pelagomonas_calceolata.AAC.7
MQVWACKTTLLGHAPCLNWDYKNPGMLFLTPSVVAHPGCILNTLTPALQKWCRKSWPMTTIRANMQVQKVKHIEGATHCDAADMNMTRRLAANSRFKTSKAELSVVFAVLAAAVNSDWAGQFTGMFLP